jgi:small-conductance mechanosensitive channel
MRLVRENALALTTLVIAACGDAVPELVETPVESGPLETASGLGSEILTEFRALTSLITPGLLAYFVLVFVLALVLRRTIGWIIKLGWRLGADPKRHLSRVKGGLDLGVVVVATLIAVRPLFTAVPLVFSVVVAVTGLIAALALPEWIQNTVAGLSLALRGQFREGDQIEVGDAAGTVDRIGLLRTRLQTADGSTISLPNRDMLRRAVRVGREQRAAPVSIELPAELGRSPEARERIRRIARLSPYRRSGASPRIEEHGDRLIVTLQTWSTADLPAAREALERTMWAAFKSPPERSN